LALKQFVQARPYGAGVAVLVGADSTVIESSMVSIWTAASAAARLPTRPP